MTCLWFNLEKRDSTVYFFLLFRVCCVLEMTKIGMRLAGPSSICVCWSLYNLHKVVLSHPLCKMWFCETAEMCIFLKNIYIYIYLPVVLVSEGAWSWVLRFFFFPDPSTVNHGAAFPANYLGGCSCFGLYLWSVYKSPISHTFGGACSGTCNAAVGPPVLQAL